jgi:hypothetical protein
MSEAEFGRAPFALLIEYVPQDRRGIYGMRAEIRPRDVDVIRLLKAHRLDRLEIYISREAEAVAETTKEIAKEREQAIDAAGPVYGFAAHLWAPLLWQSFRNSWRKSHAVHVTVSDLLDGIEIKGGLDELSFFARELASAIDKVSAKIDTAKAFEENQIRIYGPGKKIKPVKDKSGTAPSDWTS